MPRATARIPRSLRALARRLGLEAAELSEEVLREFGGLEAPEAAMILEAGVGRLLSLGLQAEYMAKILLEKLGGEELRLTEISWVEGFEGIALTFHEAGGDAVTEIYLQRDGVYLVYTLPVFEEASKEAAKMLEEAILSVDKESPRIRSLIHKLSHRPGAELSIEPETDGETSLVITVHVESLEEAPSLKELAELAAEIVEEAGRLRGKR